jgi:HD superfamily phosphohydrolase
MDTTHIAYTAEDLISHKLQRSGLLVAKPKFDRDGADLLAFMSVDNGTKFCRIQCKGRSLINSNTSSIDVYESYVTDGFVLFLFINDGNDSTSNLFCFFSNDIKEKWELKTYKEYKKIFRLSFSKSNFNNVNFSEQKIEEIKNIIRHSDVKEEFKHFFDIIKKQKDLIKLQKDRNELEKDKNELESLLKDIKHTEELKNVMEENLKIKEEYYNYAKSQYELERKLTK